MKPTMNKKAYSLVAALALAATATAQTFIPLRPLKMPPAAQTTRVLTTPQTPLKAGFDAAAFGGRKLFGALINSTTWNGSTSYTAPYGIYSFTTLSGQTPEAVATSAEYNFLSGAVRRGKFFGISDMTVMGAFNGARYITIDTATGKELKNVKKDPGTLGYALLPSSMAYNPVDDKIYSLQYNSDLSGLDWCVYNEQYDAMDKVAKFRGLYNVVALAAIPSGQMYFINSYGDLYRIDRATARPTLVGTTGVTPQLYAQSMMYDGRTGQLLWAAISTKASTLYAVDPATAATVKVEDFSNVEEWAALWSAQDAAPDAAPAKVEGLKLDYSAPGATTGTLSFAVPDTTFGGKPLTGANVHVWLDGTSLKEGAVTAGQKMSLPVTLAEGNHYVAVNLSSDAGYSPMAWTYQYAGYDTPDTVQAVTFVMENGKNTVSWKAPARGVNDGYLDAAALTYNVVRMPDSVAVATNLSATTFSETVPQDMHNYSYRIYAVNHGHTGAYNESRSLIGGNAFTAPYRQDFTNGSTLADFFTIIDGNNDGNTWRAGYNQDVRIDITDNNPKGDDWLITPAISLDAATAYRFTMNMKTYTLGYPESVELCVGTNPKDTTTFKPFAHEDSLQLYQDFSDYSRLFTVADAGKYYIGIHYKSDVARRGSMLMLKAVAVDKLGAATAPAAPEKLIVTPAADDKMEATLTLTAPTTALNGGKLDGMTAINIYRGTQSEPVHTFANPAPGAALTWTDTGITTPGKNTWRAVAQNASGAGSAAEASAFVGVLTAPYVETFDTREASALYHTSVDGVDLKTNPFYVWTYNKDKKLMSYYSFLMEDNKSITAWLYTPKFKLDGDAVYSLQYRLNVSSYGSGITNSVFMGADTTAQAMTTKVGDMPAGTNYKVVPIAHQIVTTDESKVFFGFKALSEAKNDYNNLEIDSIALTRLKSARSPYVFTDYKATPAADGSLSVDMAFNAPATDYHGNALAEAVKVDVYRGQNPVPVFTRQDVAPGTRITWTDNAPTSGFNVYSLVATNAYGTSETLIDTVFAGRDVPAPVTGLSAKGVNNNLSALIAWTAPAVGVNGGVVVPAELTYNIYTYNPADDTYKQVATGVKGDSYTVDGTQTDEQAVCYYAVEPVTPIGTGTKALVQTVLGPLYNLPFAESFAGKELKTRPWMISTVNQDVYSWGVDNPSGTYNNATPQDADGGCAYMYNGNAYEVYGGAGFISPKIHLPGAGCTLSFWVYNIATKYPNNKPKIDVYVRADDGTLHQAGSYIVGGDSEEGWKQYTIDLSAYTPSQYISFALYGYTGGHEDVMYVDNILVSQDTEGISSPTTGPAAGKEQYFDLDGRRVAKPVKGVVIKTQNGKAVKMVVK